MDKKNNTAPKENVFQTLWRWTKRMFMGASKELTDDEKFAIEKIESPGMMAVKAFFRRKLAVTALVVLVSMFLLVFIGPIFIPMDLTYTDALQANISPNYTFLKVPTELANDVRDISGYANFSIGVSNQNKLYIWGMTQNNLTNIDMSMFPAEIKDDNVAFATAGSDHIIAITADGKVIATEISGEEKLVIGETTYSVDGNNITIDGSNGTYKIEGNKLSVTDDSTAVTMSFIRK